RLPNPIAYAPAPHSEAEPQAPAPANPGERILRVTYNLAAFGSLILLGVVFLTYSIGVRVGRSRAELAAATPAVTPSPDPEPSPSALSSLRSMKLRRADKEATFGKSAKIVKIER